MVFAVGAHLYFAFQDDPVKSNKKATMLCTCEFVFEDFPMLVMQAQCFMSGNFETIFGPVFLTDFGAQATPPTHAPVQPSAHWPMRWH